MSARTPARDTQRRPVPASAGIGLRARHHLEVPERRPAVGWLEVHSENYFGAGGPARAALVRARELYPLSLHGVGLSLGSVDPLDRRHLAALAALVREFEPALVSEHLSWSSVGGTFVNDLLPLPCTREALGHMIRRVTAVQEHLGRQLLIENPSSYVAFAGAEMREWEFLSELVRSSGCGLLLDVNNVYVSAMNLGFDALEYLRGLPLHAAQEIHLAGHSVERLADGRELRIDTHSAPVCDAVWALYRQALALAGPVPTLIEWDTDIPELDVLVAEAARADALLQERDHAVAA